MSDLAIRCKACSQAIPADDVNINTGLAKCRACHAVFAVADQVQARSAVRRKPVDMPKNMTVAEGPDSLTVVRRWKRGKLALFMAFFAVLWNLIVAVLVIATTVFGTTWERTDEKVAPGFIWLFLTPFVLMGITVGYGALALLFNRTKISLEGSDLQVTHEPFRWFGRHRLDAKQIAQLFCEEYVAYKENDRPVHRMCVSALLRDGSRLQLVKGLEDASQAFYLEDLLEKRLRIAPRAVAGEFQPPAPVSEL